MQYKNLDKTDILVSRIGFGCMSLSKNTEKESIDLLRYAVAEGINYFDTADIYDKGANEILAGKALKPVRNKIILATKVGNQWRADGSGWDWNPRKDYILKAVEESLKRLQTDRIDLYQLHGGTIDDPIDETIEAFELLKQQGKILNYGISSIRPNVIREYVKRSHIVSVMMQYSLLDRRPEEEILNLLQQQGISVMVRGALAQGLLVDKPATTTYLKHSMDEVNKAKESLTKISGSTENNTQAAIDFVLNNNAVTSVVIGFRTKEQVAAALTPSFSLNEKGFEKLCTSVPVLKYEEHR